MMLTCANVEAANYYVIILTHFQRPGGVIALLDVHWVEKLRQFVVVDTNFSE